MFGDTSPLPRGPSCHSCRGKDLYKKLGGLRVIGEWSGAVEVVARVPAPQGKLARRGPFYKCLCHRCGNPEYIATSSDLRSGRIQSCGCFRNSQEFADARTTHGHRRQKKGDTSRTYNIWLEMRRRCDSPMRENYKWYGGRGITYCDRWKHFENFLSDMGECPEGLEIDRINNAGNYEPGNCRWATHKENCNNRGIVADGT